MKNKPHLLLCAIASCNLIIGCATTSAVVKTSTKNETIKDQTVQKTYFNAVTIDTHQVPTPYELSVIHFILKNTQEGNSHQMRGEKDNKLFLHKNGQKEAVFDKNGDKVTNYNQASYNYYAASDYPIKHFNFDILPWLAWGAIRNDPTSVKERLFYYSLDLSYGIQSYVFNQNEELPEIAFESLSRSEKNTYRLFKYIIFNDNYKHKLNLNTKANLKKSAQDYQLYFEQIQSLLGVKQ